jgi:hypothetical protein
VGTAIELLAALAVAVLAVWLVLEPVLRPAARSSDPLMDAPDPDEDDSPRARALRALKEIEFDRATGKLDDADYEGLKARYTAQALDAMGGSREPGAGSRAPCPVCGPRPESDAVFCSNCGRRLPAATAA